MMELVWPAHPYLAGYIDALERGWSPDNVRAEAGREELERIRQDPALFLGQQVDREAAGPPILMPDGSSVPRLPGLPDAANEGLEYVELTTDLTNAASQAVIRANGGKLVEQFQKPAVYGGAASLRFRIPLAPRTDSRSGRTS